MKKISVTRKVQLALLGALAVISTGSARAQSWFWSLPVFWEVCVAFGAVSVVTILVIHAFGYLDFFGLIGL